ncbi:MAG: tetratricopeptide repeat protein [Patescibacteria group bacterium]|jgi:tetratricopeptide (TPR) repeat protein
MGIFEIIIFVAAAIIFIILVRRFPETAEGVAPKATQNRRLFKFKFKLPQLHFKKFGPMRVPFNDSMSENDQISEPQPDVTKSAEPNINQYQTATNSQLKNLLADGQKYFDLRQLDMAEKQFLNAAAIDPKCVLAYYRLGQIYLERGIATAMPAAVDGPKRVNSALVDAEEAFMQAYKYDPANGYILHYLGRVAQIGENYNEAVEYFEKAVGEDDKNAAWHFDLGQAYLSLRQYGKAVRYLSRAWSLEPRKSLYKDALDDAKERERRQRTNKL